MTIAYPISGNRGTLAAPVVPHYINAAGDAVPLSATAPQPTAGPGTLRANDVAAVTASAYSAGNAVGALRTFAGMARVAGQGGVLQSAVIRDKAGNAVSYDLFLFDSAPTAPTDKSAVAMSAADLAKCIGVIPFSGTALGAAATMGMITASGIGLAYKLTAGTTLYGILVTRGAPTYTGTADVSVDLVALPD